MGKLTGALFAAAFSIIAVFTLTGIYVPSPVTMSIVFAILAIDALREAIKDD